ncbi:MAG: recombinase zinc beta ribbon domain-containing protein [Chloroflexota bacterium]|nr:recombinase zinc beta ribbon domain-containing protein [Chloroflexota bacterium]
MPVKKIERALSWAAVSSREQASADKFSVEDQIARNQKIADERGWTIIETLIVPGHSRHYSDIRQLADIARKKGIDAFARLLWHIEQRDFNVLIVRDADRFARKASLMWQILEMVVDDCGAYIYSDVDSMLVDRNNVDMFGMVKAYKTNREQKDRVERFRKGILGRAERGLIPAGLPHLTHMRVFDAKGTEVGTALNPDCLPLMQDLATLFLEGVGYQRLGDELLNRFGHRNEQGVAYNQTTLRKLLFNPHTWGHVTIGHAKRDVDQRYHAFWAFDRTVEPPDGVQIFYDKVPAVYSGTQAALIQQEIRRRSEMKGKRRPHSRHALTGLLVCYECGSLMHVAYTHDDYGTRQYYRCGLHSEHSKRSGKQQCSQHKYIAVGAAQKAFETLLQDMANGVPTALAPVAPRTIADLRQQRSSVDKEMQRLIVQMSQIDASAALDAIHQRLNALGRSAEELDTQIKNAESDSWRRKSDAQRRQRIMEMLIELNYAHEFWERHSPRECNQILHTLLGDYRLAILNGKPHSFVIPE